ncbi:MAG: hypothetical protein M1834_006828 [Cirrosporium novae-zelandiae]|nr:MAG: hypothetical protein M1834_006828 [Cirrosporium novae-zelandiae]
MAQVEFASQPSMALGMAFCADNNNNHHHHRKPQHPTIYTDFSSLPQPSFAFPTPSQPSPLRYSVSESSSNESPSTSSSVSSNSSETSVSTMGTQAFMATTNLSENRPRSYPNPGADAQPGTIAWLLQNEPIHQMNMSQLPVPTHRRPRVSNRVVGLQRDTGSQPQRHRRMQTMDSMNLLSGVNLAEAMNPRSPTTPSPTNSLPAFSFNPGAPKSPRSMPPSPATATPRSRGHIRSQSFTVAHYGSTPVFERLRPTPLSSGRQPDLRPAEQVFEDENDHPQEDAVVLDEFFANFEEDNDVVVESPVSMEHTPASPVPSNKTEPVSTHTPSSSAPQLTITTTVEQALSPIASPDDTHLQPLTGTLAPRPTSSQSRKFNAFRFPGESMKVETLMRSALRDESGMIDIDLGVDPLAPSPTKLSARPSTSSGGSILGSSYSSIPPVPPIPAEWERRYSAPALPGALDRRQKHRAMIFEKIKEETEGDSCLTSKTASTSRRRRHRPAGLQLSASYASSSYSAVRGGEESISPGTMPTEIIIPAPTDSDTSASTIDRSLSNSPPPPSPPVPATAPLVQPPHDMALLTPEIPRPSTTATAPSHTRGHISYASIDHGTQTMDDFPYSNSIRRGSAIPPSVTTFATEEGDAVPGGTERRKKKSRAKKFKKLLLFWRSKEKSHSD